VTWGKSALLTIPLLLSGIFAVASPASAKDFSDTNWKTVSAGGAHACGTDTSGFLYCWGSDDHGQLGNTSSFNSKATPNRVGDSTGWTVVSAGSAHTCGIRTGKLFCWGSDSDGQLGNGSSTTADQGLPQQIGSLSDWKTVSAGRVHTCAIRGSGYLYCWGSDSDGELGNGSTAGSQTWPTRVAGTATTWKSVSAGDAHTCGILGRGYLYCWGDDSDGQLGNGSAGSASSPYRVSGTATSWSNVSAGGAHTCGMLSTRLYCWGDNQYGQSVTSSDEVRFTSPQALAGAWTAQDTGQRHTCAIGTDGRLTCWGVPEAPAPPDCPAPPTNIYASDPWQNLGYWKLTTPVDGTDSGDSADEVKQPALKTLDNQDYFDRRTDGSIMFRARVDGATTSGSSFPRSELREMTQDGQYNRAAWSSACGTHRMTVTQAITAQPNRSNPEDPVVAGQIHDGGVDDGRGDVAMIRLEGSRLFVEADGNDRGTLDSNYQLGQRFTVSLTARASGITVRYDNSANNTGKTIGPFAPTVNNKQWFFKAGCYPQANTSNGTGYGEVVIYSVDVSHTS
jgi:alpha-tubulin suppressor-like RCC1 family protein